MTTTTRRSTATAPATAKKGGDDEQIPLFLGSSGLRSLRDSGFHFSAALGEPIDNSLESKANKISVVLEDGTMPSGKKGIARIIIADDGTGMEEAVLRRYLQIGFSTRYMSTKTIGKYGVGAKLAAISVAQRIDVWSRTSASAPWRHVHLDLKELEKVEAAGEQVFLGEPDDLPFPPGMSAYVPEGSGTVVVWSNVDRLEEGRGTRDTGKLRVEIERDIARTFRYFLDGGIRIEVNGKALMPYDPLFLMEGTYNDVVLTKEYPDTMSGTRVAGQTAADLRHFAAELIADEQIPVGDSLARLRVTLYPREVLRAPSKGGDELAKKLNIPGSEGVISFVRLDREINYTLVPRIFPSAVREPDRFIGIEVSFRPELDAYFGVRNVKRGVEPEDQLREEIRNRLSRYVNTARKRLKAVWAAANTAQHKGEHDPLVEAVADADRTLPKGRVERPAGSSDDLLRQMAKDVGQGTEQGINQYIEKHRALPFVLESMDFPGHSFIDVQHTSGQTLIRLNVRHRFYKELWAPLRKIVDSPDGTYTDDIVELASRGVEVLTLLVLAYGKAESMQTNPHELYDELRDYWGIFLNQFLSKVKDVV